MEPGDDPVEPFAEDARSVDGTSLLEDVAPPSNTADLPTGNMLLASDVAQAGDAVPPIDDADMLTKEALPATNSAVVSDDAAAPASDTAFPELAAPPSDDTALPEGAVPPADGTALPEGAVPTTDDTALPEGAVPPADDTTIPEVVVSPADDVSLSASNAQPATDKDTALGSHEEPDRSGAIEEGSGVSAPAAAPSDDSALPSGTGSPVDDTALNGEGDVDEDVAPVEDWDAKLRTIIEQTEKGEVAWQRGLKILAGAVLDARQQQCAVSNYLQNQVDIEQSRINEVETATVTLANKIKLFDAELSAHVEKLKRELAKKQGVDKANEKFLAVNNLQADFRKSLLRCDSTGEELLTRTETSKARLDNAASNTVESFKRCEKLERKLNVIELRSSTTLQELVDDVKKLKIQDRQSSGQGYSTEHHQRTSVSVVDGSELKALQARVTVLESQKIAQAISTLSKKVHDGASRCQVLDQAMGGRVAQLREEATSRSVYLFRHKWREVHKKRSWKLVQKYLSSWFTYIRRTSTQKASVVQGMARLQRLLMQRRVVPRFRTWWYASQKDLHTKEFERLTEFTNTIHTQVTQMTAANTKKEKAQAEQMENIVYRAVSIESRVESISARKADALVVKEQISAMQNTIFQACDFDRLQKMIEDVDEKFRPLEKKKADLAVVEMQTSRLNKLSFDMARNFTRLEDELHTRATKSDFKDKADSKTVEKAMVMLSSQMDRLTLISGQDMENFRRTLIQYLELSPDLRKAALSQGMKSNENCMTCKVIRHDVVTPPIRGNDDKLYQHMSPASQQAHRTGAKHLVNQCLRTPTRLGSAIGGRRLDISSPASPMSEDKISMDQMLHSTFAEAVEVKPKTQNERCSSIKLFFRGAAAPDKDGTDPTPRRSFRLEKRGVRSEARSVMHPPIERTASVMSESECDSTY